MRCQCAPSGFSKAKTFCEPVVNGDYTTFLIAIAKYYKFSTIPLETSRQCISFQTDSSTNLWTRGDMKSRSLAYSTCWLAWSTMAAQIERSLGNAHEQFSTNKYGWLQKEIDQNNTEPSVCVCARMYTHTHRCVCVCVCIFEHHERLRKSNTHTHTLTFYHLVESEETPISPRSRPLVPGAKKLPGALVFAVGSTCSASAAVSCLSTIW